MKCVRVGTLEAKTLEEEVGKDAPGRTDDATGQVQKVPR